MMTRLRNYVAAYILVVLLAQGVPLLFFECAFAEEVTSAKAQETLQISAPTQVILGCLEVSELAVLTMPELVQVGVSCNMPEMCGENPCLCGATDAWGYCACNGTTDVYADLEFSGSALDFVKVVQFGEGFYVLPTGAGEGVLEVTAHLRHYDDAYSTIYVSVEPFSVFDIFKITLLFLIAAAAVFGVVAAIRRVCVTRGMKRISKLEGEDSGEGSAAGVSTSAAHTYETPQHKEFD